MLRSLILSCLAIGLPSMTALFIYPLFQVVKKEEVKTPKSTLLLNGPHVAVCSLSNENSMGELMLLGCRTPWLAQCAEQVHQAAACLS